MKSFKILFVVPSLSKGGAASGARNLLTALQTQNVEIIVVEAANHQSRFSKLFRFIERLFDHFFFNSNIHFFKFFKASIDLRQLITIHSPDVVQLCNISGNLVDYSYYTEGMPVVFHRMSDFWPYKGCQHYYKEDGRLEKVNRWFYFMHSFELLIQANRVAPSRWLINELSDNKVFQSQIDFIPNAVSLGGSITVKDPALSLVKFGFISTDLNDERKGLKRMLSLVDHENFELHLFGAGNTSDLSLDHCKVITHGRFEGGDLSHVFSNFDILLCPSLYDNSPNVVLEAMSFGIPVIGSIDTGMESYITAGTGHLFDFASGSKAMFYNLVTEVIDCYPSYRESCLAHVEKFSPENIGASYLELYNLKTHRSKKR